MSAVVGLYSIYRIVDPFLHHSMYEPIRLYLPSMHGAIDLQVEPMEIVHGCTSANRNFCRQCWHDVGLDTPEWRKACKRSIVSSTESYVLSLRGARIQPSETRIMFADGDIQTIPFDLVSEYMSMQSSVTTSLLMGNVEYRHMESTIHDKLESMKWGTAPLLDKVVSRIRNPGQLRSKHVRPGMMQEFQLKMMHQQWLPAEIHMYAIFDDHHRVTKVVEDEDVAMKLTSSKGYIPIQLLKVFASVILMGLFYQQGYQVKEPFVQYIDVDDAWKKII